MKRLGVLFFIGYAVSGGVAHAATYYVSKAGSNGSSCAQAQSISTPKLTINGGVACLSAGDTLLVRAGTYDEGISNVPSGTSWTNKVRIASYPGETVWMAPTVPFAGNPGEAIRFQSVSPSYVEFDGINMDGRTMAYGTVGFVIDSTGEPHHIRVQNAEIIGRTTDNSAFSSGAAMPIEIHGGRPTVIGGFEFRFLTIHGGGRPGTGSYEDNGYGIYLAAPNNLVENCDIYDGKGAGIHAFNDDGEQPNNNIIRNNRIHDETRNSNIGQLWGMLIEGANNQVYNNVIYRVNADPATSAGGDGIAVNGSGNSIWNNTIFNSAGRGLFIVSSATSTVVTNNIIYGNGTNYVNSGASTIHDHNIDDGTNPLFTNSGADDFTLQASSPARNTGATIAQVTTDIVGTARPKESIYDIGAYELTMSASAPAPTAPAAPTGLRVLN